jgi:hypothetical protein
MRRKTTKISTGAYAKRAAKAFRSGKLKSQSVESVISQLRKIRKEDEAGKFKSWKPRHLDGRSEDAAVCNC